VGVVVEMKGGPDLLKVVLAVGAPGELLNTTRTASSDTTDSCQIAPVDVNPFMRQRPGFVWFYSLRCRWRRHGRGLKRK
jgi:hypothetical protein